MSTIEHPFIGELIQCQPEPYTRYCVCTHVGIAKDLNIRKYINLPETYVWGYWGLSIDEAIKVYETIPLDLSLNRR